MAILLILLLGISAGAAQAATELWLRGYSVIPTPQKVELKSGEVVVDESWAVEGGRDSTALLTLLEDAQRFHKLRLRPGAGGGKTIRLALRPGEVATGAGKGIDGQAYRLEIAESGISIVGNAEPGLFYGVQTLLQLLKRDSAGRLVAPLGVIEDFPKLELRFLHWDTKHHQDRIETLKRRLDWAARFKVNMIAFELEDKFAYPSHPVIGAPGAFTVEELQEIVDYGLKRHIQVTPLVQAPAHMAFVLKHEEFAELKADGNNFQSAMCDPRTEELIFSMYDDVISATKGVDYFYVSTDEVYYAGIDSRCEQEYNEKNRSLRWVEFVQHAAKHLARQGRRPLAWVEYPLLTEHVKLLPPELIDGITGKIEYIEHQNEIGMRQLAYASMQGGEYLFPDHLSLERGAGSRRARLADAYERIAHGKQWKGNPIGAFAAAWDDSGLHSETFWLGWSAVAQWAWNPGRAPVEQHAAEFMRFYYGPGAASMIDVYRSMQRQARAWQRTWERVDSRVRTRRYGNSFGKGIGGSNKDMTLSPPAMPTTDDLSIEPAFRSKYGEFLKEAESRGPENDRLLLALEENLGRVERNHYNLEVFLALARFMGHHWRLLEGLAGAEDSVGAARASAQKGEAAQAVGQMVAAHNTIERLSSDGEEIFDALRRVFEKSRYPKGRSVGGRDFVHIFDDTKDHWADRAPDLTFMVLPERSIGLDDWLDGLSKAIRSYAKKNNVPAKGLAEARLEE